MNTQAKEMDVKSPPEFIDISTEHARKQFETLTEQAQELVALAQKVTLATTEPLIARFESMHQH